MNQMFGESVLFGLVLTLVTFYIATFIQKKTQISILNPMLVSAIMIIIFLLLTNTSYETFYHGGRYISDFLTPATVCLAVPMYRQFRILVENKWAVLGGILAGCIGHAVCVVLMGIAFSIDKALIVSVLPKSVTTAIAMGVCEESGGIIPVVIIGVTVAGNLGAMFAPMLLKLFKIDNPVAQGLSIGCCSHALGTSTAAVPMGEVQGAMSSLSIVVTGIMTVVIVPIVVNLL